MKLFVVVLFLYAFQSIESRNSKLLEATQSGLEKLQFSFYRLQNSYHANLRQSEKMIFSRREKFLIDVEKLRSKFDTMSNAEDIVHILRIYEDFIDEMKDYNSKYPPFEDNLANNSETLLQYHNAVAFNIDTLDWVGLSVEDNKKSCVTTVIMQYTPKALESMDEITQCAVETRDDLAKFIIPADFLVYQDILNKTTDEILIEISNCITLKENVKDVKCFNNLLTNIKRKIEYVEVRRRFHNLLPEFKMANSIALDCMNKEYEKFKLLFNGAEEHMDECVKDPTSTPSPKTTPRTRINWTLL